MLTVAKASAGAGKTFLLAKTYIDMLFHVKGRHRHRHILAVTFTKKATAEMKRRIITELAKLATGAPSDYHDFLTEKYTLDEDTLCKRAQDVLYDLLQDYSAFMVTTIDSFFQQIIRAFARELNLSGSYNLELDSRHILRMAVDDFFFNLSDDDKDASVQILMQIVEEKIEEGKSWNPEDRLYTLSHELLKEIYQSNSAALERLLSDRDAFSAYHGRLRQLVENYMNSYRLLEQRLETLLQTHQVGESDFSYGKQALAPFHWNKQKILTDYAKLPVRFGNLCDDCSAIVKKTSAQLLPVAQDVQTLACELRKLLSGRALQQMLSAEAVLEHLPYLNLLLDISRYIAEANHRLNRLPIAETNALLCSVIGAGNDTPFVYDKTGTRIRHYLIDEYQDTSTAQWNNFRPLVRESLANGNDNLVVGDVKQSIYRWRNSDYSLLQSGIFEDFPRAFSLSMNDNWRSDRIVVETNNELFDLLSDAENTECNNLMDERYPALVDKIKNVYATLQQTACRCKEDGYVRFEFQQAESDKERRDKVLERLPGLIENIRQRNIPLGRVAVLVRRNSEAVPVASTLIGAGYNVLSGEGLLLTAAPQVRFVIAVLQWLLSPADRISRVQVLYEHALIDGKTASEALREALEGCDTPMEEGIWQELAGLQHLSLYETVQYLVSRFGLDVKDTAKPYVQGLQDTLYNYVRRYQADLFSFLEWWKEKARELVVAAQTDGDALQILSIHKSKGLEYDVVIIPFCDWPKAAARKGNRLDILWARPASEPFADGGNVPLLPLRFSDRLADTVFAEDYWREVQDMYLDNLNLTYVAFTRAKRELYVFAPSSETIDSKGNCKENTSTIGALLHYLLKNRRHSLKSNAGEDGVYENGERVEDTAVSVPDTAGEQEECLSAPLAGRLRIKRTAYKAFVRERPADLKTHLDLGIVMHDLLCKVTKQGDEQAAMDDLLQQGGIEEKDKRILQQEFARFWQLVEATDWFGGGWHVVNERDILLPDGTVQRPDRVMIRENEAVVVDYKFGAKERGEYTIQVQDYMRLLASMHYQVRGYLCYVNQDKIREVTL